MADYAHQWQTSSEADAVTSFVAYVQSFKSEGPALVLSSDDAGLTWLMQSLDQLKEGKSRAFMIGDGTPVASDGMCLVELRCDDGGATRIERRGKHEFAWMLSRKKLAEYIELVAGLLRAAGPGHQYLDMDEPSSPTFILSKNEYTIDLLRAMRE